MVRGAYIVEVRRVSTWGELDSTSEKLVDASQKALSVCSSLHNQTDQKTIPTSTFSSLLTKSESRV
jgi:hypothetical protein